MSLIDAVVVEPTARGHVVLKKVEPPQPRPGEALVRVHATSLNRGEIRQAGSGPAGRRIGWDFAGIVECAADDVPGPKAGTRVVGMLRTGAWAELIAAPVESLAVLPDKVDFSRAASLPVAGLTALYGLDRAPGLIARHLLVTGGTGGVGHLAIQLGKLGGARVIATVRREEQAKIVREAGADAVVVGDDKKALTAHGPYDFVLDGVGGATLGTAAANLAKKGAIVVYGATGGGEIPFDVRSFYPVGGASIYGFILFHELLSQPAGLGLARLVELVEAGKLRPPIEVEGKLAEIAELAQQLEDRKFVGKAIVHFG
ncbi:MAG: zinc-binding dehydrogenase [Polyangiales bacterium]